jgi:hypothetical protein
MNTIIAPDSETESRLPPVTVPQLSLLHAHLSTRSLLDTRPWRHPEPFMIDTRIVNQQGASGTLEVLLVVCVKFPSDELRAKGLDLDDGKPLAQRERE